MLNHAAKPAYSPPDLEARKALGRAHLAANRIEQALQVYAAILRDNPQDADAYLFLGDCYLAGGDGRTAAMLYGQALALAPENATARRRLALAELESGTAQPAPGSDPAAVGRLLQQLTGRAAPIADEEVQRAAGLLGTIIHSPRPALAVAENMEQIDALLPALLELNIRQARLDGRPDLAEALENLLCNIQMQLQAQPEAPPAAAPAPAAETPHLPPAAAPSVEAQVQKPAPLRVLLLAPAAAGDTDGSLAEARLRSQLAACQVTVSAGLDEPGAGAFSRYDVAVAFRPHGDADRPACRRLMEALAACSAGGLPVALYLDQDYEQLPIEHPDYPRLGPGTPARARALASAMLLADVILTNSAAQAASLAAAGYPAAVLPLACPGEGPYPAAEPPPSARRLNLGWIGAAGQIEDLAQVRRIVTRVLREFPHTRLVIAGEPAAYQLFDSLPESRRLFLPAPDIGDAEADEQLRYLLKQVDILIDPRRNTLYHQTLPDCLLAQAGACGVPWVAAPLPAYVEWAAGGLIAHSLDEWHTHLRQLISDGELRRTLAAAGRAQAAERAPALVARRWEEILRALAQSAARPIPIEKLKLPEVAPAR